MKIPNLVGERLDEGLTILRNDYRSLNVIVNEYTIPEDFYKKNVLTGVKRIVRQKITQSHNLELVVFTFNESPRSL